METQNTTNQKAAQAPKVTFTRKARIGINPITVDEKQTVYIEVQSKNVETMQNKAGDEIDFVKAINLETGEEGHFWLSGQLRHQFETIAKGARGTLEGMKFEITHKGKKPVEINGKTQQVNQYDVYELN